MELPQKLIDFVNESRTTRGLGPVASPDEPLQLDSLALIRLIAFFENDLDLRIEDDEIMLENFQTFGAISRLLEKKAANSSKQ